MIDASPDLRTQLLRAKIDDLHGVIITHDHADHTHGMDDLRPFGFKGQNPLPVYCDLETAETLRIKFPYIFERSRFFAGKPVLGGGIPLLDLYPTDSDAFQILGETLKVYSLPHGHSHSLGIQHSKMAYLTDCREIPEVHLKQMAEARLEILLIDCLRYHPHSTHLHLERTLEYVKIINPRQAVLIHMGHEIDYLELMERLRMQSMKNILPAIDGMSFLYS